MRKLARRVVLAGSGAVFGLIALAAIGWPRAVAARYGLTLDGVDAMNEFRAVFTGFWLALAAAMILAARREEEALLGDLCGLALVLQAGGRLLSVAFDGTPRIAFVAAMIGEGIAGVIVLAGRARPPAIVARAPAPAVSEVAPSKPAAEPVVAAPSKPAEPDHAAALELLALFQREGRLVDFLEQDIASFSDGDVGVAARVVHDGCRKALRDHAAIVPVRDEEEGAKVTIEAGYDPGALKLVGAVRGKAPFQGVLRHRGWRAERLSLPVAVEDHDEHILAPAEVEL